MEDVRGPDVHSSWGDDTGTDNSDDNDAEVTPQTSLALLKHLVQIVGAAESDVTLCDASRLIRKCIYDKCHAAFPNVRFVDRVGGNGRIKVAKDPTARVYYSDTNVGYSGTTELPACIAEATYVINLAAFRGHTVAGVTLAAKNHFGSIWRPEGDMFDGWRPNNLHDYVDVHDRAIGTYNALVDLMGHEHIGGKQVLYVIDGLYGSKTQGDLAPIRWQSPPFNDDWPSCLFVSQDPVALESVAVDFMRNEPALSEPIAGNLDNYLHEAAQAGSPPSSTVYDPEADGTPLASLGVHEHWDSAATRRYSKNLGRPGPDGTDGIELIAISPALPWMPPMDSVLRDLLPNIPHCRPGCR